SRCAAWPRSTTRCALSCAWPTSRTDRASRDGRLAGPSGWSAEARNLPPGQQRSRTEICAGPLVSVDRLVGAGEVRGQLGQVGVAEAGADVVDVARRPGVEEVVVVVARLVQRGERGVPVRREPVDGRVPEADPVPEQRVDQRGRAVELGRHEAGTAPADLERVT